MPLHTATHESARSPAAALQPTLSAPQRTNTEPRPTVDLPKLSACPMVRTYSLPVATQTEHEHQTAQRTWGPTAVVDEPGHALGLLHWPWPDASSLGLRLDDSEQVVLGIGLPEPDMSAAPELGAGPESEDAWPTHSDAPTGLPDDTHWPNQLGRMRSWTSTCTAPSLTTAGSLTPTGSLFSLATPTMPSPGAGAEGFSKPPSDLEEPHHFP